ncbi:MAG: zinc ribbon domain-containing protein [Firmicutes bacterium]|nr:zinc ribbon domain-containing protein [Bacillota bacterium]
MEGNKQQQAVRNTLRSLGPIILGVGVLFTVIGFVSFLKAFSGGGPPTRFWCAFVGLPLIALGSSLARFGYMGDVSRYVAGEVAPVAKDTINYLADGSAEAIKKVSQAVSEGIAESRVAATPAGSTTLVRCHKCNHTNRVDAKYCNECGTALLKVKRCPGCQELNDPDARFCDNCGTQFAHK